MTKKSAQNQQPAAAGKDDNADAAAGVGKTESEASALAARSPEFITVTEDLPADLPDELRAKAMVVVKAKSDRGRWRASRHFTREETLIPLADLTADQLVALRSDPELVVATRVPTKI